MEINTLKKEYDLKKDKIKERLNDFKEIFNKGNKEIFEELCFCILTPNASARMGINAMNSLKPILYTGNLQDLQNALKRSSYRYPNKRASHYLRNIGFKGYCIIDRHILNCLKEANVIPSNERPKNKKQYLEIEQKMKEFAEAININIDELDLLLWSHKTGEILK